MTADLEGTSAIRGVSGAAGELCRPTPEARERWRGPGWRVFDGCPGQGKQVRDWITSVVSRHECPADPSDAALLVSELFANALIHGPAGGRVLVGYCLWPGGARIVVSDAGGYSTPRLREPGEREEGGRGLQVVDVIAAAWGTFRAGQARAVWCDLGMPLGPAAFGEDWAWLRAVLAGVTSPRRAPRRPGEPRQRGQEPAVK